MNVPENSPEAGIISESSSIDSSVLNTATEAGAFVGFRAASNILWVGGAVGSYYARTKFGIEPAVMMPVLGAAVAGVEYAGTSQAIKIFDKGGSTAEIDTVEQEKAHRLLRVVKEVGALAYVAWNGAMSGVKVNNSLGLESNRRRRIAQSATYGAAVSLYSLPFLQDGVVEIGKAAIENPTETTVISGIGSLATYGLVKGYQAVRHRYNERKSNKE